MNNYTAYLVAIIDTQQPVPTVVGVRIYSESGDNLTRIGQQTAYATLWTTQGNTYHDARISLVDIIYETRWFEWVREFITEDGLYKSLKTIKE